MNILKIFPSLTFGQKIMHTHHSRINILAQVAAAVRSAPTEVWVNTNDNVPKI